MRLRRKLKPLNYETVNMDLEGYDSAEGHGFQKLGAVGTINGVRFIVTSVRCENYGHNWFWFAQNEKQYKDRMTIRTGFWSGFWDSLRGRLNATR